jgi:HemK-like putative methylase
MPQEITNINIKKLGLEDRATFIYSDLLKYPIEKGKRYDIIVSNPPYIKDEVIPTLMEDVKNFEPYIALSGGQDGMVFYRRIVDESTMVLNENGILAFEIGYDQGVEVEKLMLEKGYNNVKIIKDLASLDRVVIGEWKAHGL